MKNLLIPVFIIVLGILAIGGCDYVLTKKALTDLRGEEPKPATIIWVMLNGDKARVRVEK